MYCVISCDIINSKKIIDIDNILKNKIKDINEKYSENNFITKFTLSRGDEIQGVVKYDENIFSNIRKIRYALYPIKLRIGIGIGNIGEINFENSWEMNGEAFHNAREALEKISKEKETTTYFYGSEMERLELLNSFYLLVDKIVEKWSEKSWEAAIIYEEEKTIRATAEKINIKEQSAAQRIETAKIKTILLAEEKIKNIFLTK